MGDGVFGGRRIDEISATVFHTRSIRCVRHVYPQIVATTTITAIL